MSTNSKVRIFLVCLLTASGAGLIVPSSNPWIKTSVALVAVLLLLAAVAEEVHKNTIDWSKKTKDLMAIYWDLEKDVLWIMRQNEGARSIRQDVGCSFVDVYELKDDGKNGMISFMMDSIPFEREVSELVMNEGGYMILKQGNIRLKIPKSDIVEKFYAA